MKKIIGKVTDALERLALLAYTEPVVVRMGLATALNLLVVSGAFTDGVSTQIQTVVLAALNLVFLVSTRRNVTPTLIADLARVNAYLRGHRHSKDIAAYAAEQAVDEPTPTQ